MSLYSASRVGIRHSPLKTQFPLVRACQPKVNLLPAKEVRKETHPLASQKATHASLVIVVPSVKEAAERLRCPTESLRTMSVTSEIRYMLSLRETSNLSPCSRQCPDVDFASRVGQFVRARKTGILWRIRHRYRYKKKVSRTPISDAETIDTRSGSNATAAAAIVERRGAFNERQ